MREIIKSHDLLNIKRGNNRISIRIKNIQSDLNNDI